MGTAHYMSPEQAAGEPLDGRSDLYALGVVAYQALAGRPPFDAPTVAALLAKHLTQAPPPLPAGVPSRLAGVVLACLDKERDERPATGEALADLLDAIEAERTLPAPLRAFAEARDPLLVLYAVWSGGFAASTLVRVALYLGHMLREPPFSLSRFIVQASLVVALPVVPFLAFQLRHAVKALAAGYGVEDLRLALARDAERVAAESSEPEIFPPPLATAYRVVTYAAVGAMLAFLFSAPFVGRRIDAVVPGWLIGAFLLATVLLGVTGSALGLTWPGRPSSSENIERLRRRFWRRRAGEATAAMLARFSRRRRGAAYIPRATELAIGHAADALFAALPPATRAGLGELPALVRRLEREAEAMRTREAELSARLAAVHAAPPALRGQAHHDLAAELRDARDAAAHRRDAALGVLETVRLDLLRLQAGIGDAESLTSVIERARQLGNDVDALLAGRREAGATADRGLPSSAEERAVRA
jgi:serine/threonine-protein kinase